MYTYNVVNRLTISPAVPFNTAGGRDKKNIMLTREKMGRSGGVFSTTPARMKLLFRFPLGIQSFPGSP